MKLQERLAECEGHTPGPWEVDSNSRYPIMVHSVTEKWPLVDDGVEVGRIGAFVANAGDSAANAKLIALAPEMKAALDAQAARIRELEAERDAAMELVVLAAAWLHAAYDRPPQTPEARALLSTIDAAIAAREKPQ